MLEIGLQVTHIVASRKGESDGPAAEQRHVWSSPPGRMLLVTSACDLLVVSALAALGLLMTPVSPVFIALTLLLAFVFMLLLDQAKHAVMHRPLPQAHAQ